MEKLLRDHQTPPSPLPLFFLSISLLDFLGRKQLKRLSIVILSLTLYSTLCKRGEQARFFVSA